VGSPELLTPGGRRRWFPGARPALSTVAAVVATTWLCTAAAMAGWSLLPVLGGWHPYVIVSGSMAPRIEPGDVVCVDPGALAGLHRGQIVVVHDPVRPGRLLAHRVVEVRRDGSLVTKGDANPVPDSTHVPAGGAVGVVRLVVPSIGRLALLRTDPRPDGLGLIGVTALAAVLMAVLRPHERVQTSPTGRLRWHRSLQPGLRRVHPVTPHRVVRERPRRGPIRRALHPVPGAALSSVRRPARAAWGPPVRPPAGPARGSRLARLSRQASRAR
jgi:signal peptidase I